MKLSYIVLAAAWLLLSQVGVAVAQSTTVKLAPPQGPLSAPRDATFASLSIEPAFWTEFFGTKDAPNKFFLGLLGLVRERTGKSPNIRPGGIAMDSLIFDPQQKEDLVRVTNPATGAVYRTTVGPAFYESWKSTLPSGSKVVVTLNLQNLTYDIARDAALAAVQYAGPDRILAFEVGNEPNSYWNATGPNGGTQGYVDLWKNWTSRIDQEVNTYVQNQKLASFPAKRWWASSTTTDDTAVKLRPLELIPDGVDSGNNIAQYSIHNYQWSTCDPPRTAQATIPNVLNISAFNEYADTQVMPSANAATQAGSEWVIGEYNSVSCSGRVNVTDTPTQALWHLFTTLGYATRNASATYLHQGGTLALQSNQQENNAATKDGKPAFSAYDLAYPIDSAARGTARANPGFLSLLVLAEAFGRADGVRVASPSLPAGAGVSQDRFAAYSFHDEDSASANRLLLLNTEPFYGGNGNTVTVDISALAPSTNASTSLFAKRLTTPSVDTTDATKVTWAGQHYANGTAAGQLNIEKISGTTVTIRASEALLVWLQNAQPFDLAANATTAAGSATGASAAGSNSAAGISAPLLSATVGTLAFLLFHL